MEDYYSNKFQWKYFWRQLMVSSMAWCFYFMYGMVLGTPTVAMPQLRSTTRVDEEMASWISSIMGYIGILWVFILNISVHHLGIKKTSLIQVSNTFTAYVVLYFSRSPMQVLISQILHGCTAASQTSTTLLILTEYTTPKYRGVFLTIKSATLFWGIWVANSIGLFLPYKYIGLLGIICTIYVFIIIFLIPESPYWLARREMYVEITAAHRWLKGEGTLAEKELQELIATQKSERRCGKARKTLIQRANYYATLVTQPDWYKPIGLILAFYVMYFVSGKIVLTVYAIDIIKKKKTANRHIGMLILDGFMGMYAGCGLSKIFKRRRLLLTTSSIATTFLFVMAAYLFLVRLGIIKENAYASIVLLMAFSLSIACGPMIMVTTLIGELIPLKSSCFSICLGASVANLLLGVILKVAPYMVQGCGLDGAFLFFAVGSTIIFIIVYKYLPETKDKSLLQIAGYFRIEKATEFELASLTRQSAS